MSAGDVLPALRRYWPVGAIVGACLLLALLLRILGGDKEAQQRADSTPAVGRSALPHPVEEAPRLPPAPPTRARHDKRKETRALIDEYQHALDSRSAKDTPATLMAMGNLYRQKLLDYEKASECYLRIIEEYPDSPQASSAWVQLSTCYEELNAGERLNRLHLDMLEHFPEGSQEHAYARHKLGWD